MNYFNKVYLSLIETKMTKIVKHHLEEFEKPINDGEYFIFSQKNLMYILSNICRYNLLLFNKFI